MMSNDAASGNLRLITHYCETDGASLVNYVKRYKNREARAWRWIRIWLWETSCRRLENGQVMHPCMMRF